eukprot:scaffold95950_cov19-Tisochrysis_lutea.AAC.1
MRSRTTCPCALLNFVTLVHGLSGSNPGEWVGNGCQLAWLFLSNCSMNCMQQLLCRMYAAIIMQMHAGTGMQKAHSNTMQQYK